MHRQVELTGRGHGPGSCGLALGEVGWQDATGVAQNLVASARKVLALKVAICSADIDYTFLVGLRLEKNGIF